MDTDYWDQLSALFKQALPLPPEQRRALLDQAGADQPTLRKEVEEMLDYNEKTGLSGALDGLFVDAFKSWNEVMHIQEGQVISRYRILEKLGAGGMGVVYKAMDQQLDRTVALKFLSPHLSLHEEVKQRFIREAKAASAIDHPNICTVYEIDVTSGEQLFIAMPFYEGKTLKQRIEQGPLALDMVLDTAAQIADGLAQAHARGVVHRDVKPANVIVTPEARVKLLDFGVAKLGDEGLTRTGATLGTVAYMSPEQARGGAVDHRTDIWSLGVLLYEMLTGQRPFKAEKDQALVYAILNQDPQPVSGLRAGVPMQLAALVEKTLAKSPDERYQRMQDMLDDVRAVQERNAVRHTAEQDMRLPYSNRPLVGFSAGRSATSEVAPISILVVDDEPQFELLIRKAFRRQVRAEEWRFTFAMNGQEAIDAISADLEIALVMTDLNMPVMGGLHLLRLLSELDRPLKTVVISAYDDIDNIRSAMNRGAFDFVTKPFDFEDLEKTIRKAHQELINDQKAAEAQQQLALMHKEVEVAWRIQEAILPLAFPPRDDLNLYAYCTPAYDISGTFYDYFDIGEGKVGFMLGDVGSKGVSAALFMAMCQTYLQNIAMEEATPGACLTSVNRLLFPQGFPDLGVALFYGMLDTRTGRLAFSNAGQPAPYLLREGSIIAPLDAPVDIPVWRQRDYGYGTHDVTLQPGEGLFLYTRGITQTANRQNRPFSAERLAALLRDDHDAPPVRIIRDVMHAVTTFSEGALAHDLTALALRYHPHPPVTS